MEQVLAFCRSCVRSVSVVGWLVGWELEKKGLGCSDGWESILDVWVGIFLEIDIEGTKGSLVAWQLTT